MSKRDESIPDAQPATTETTRSTRVLLVDDDADLRETLRIWLESDGGVTVEEAPTGGDALEMVDESVDILTLDRSMQALSGSDVIERLGDDSFEGQIIVLSSHKPDEHLNETMVAEYLVKPIDKQAFIGTIRKYQR